MFIDEHGDATWIAKCARDSVRDLVRSEGRDVNVVAAFGQGYA
jgi:hypothetical protein